MATSERFEATLIKKESVYATDPTPGTGDAVRLKDRLTSALSPRHVFENRNDDLVTNSLVGYKIGLPRGSVFDLNLRWHMRGKGSAYSNADTDIEASPLFQACGMSATLDATGGAEKITWALAESGHASAAMYGYWGADRAKILGMRGNLKWPINGGEQGEAIYSMTGMVLTDPDAQSVPSASYDAANAPTAVGCGFTLNPGSSYIPNWMKGELNLGNNVQAIEDGNGTDGLAGIEIVDRVNPQFTCTIRKDALSSFNPRNLYKSVTSHLINLTLGQTQYNRFKLAVTESYLSKDPKPVSYRGYAGWDLVFDLKAFTIVAD